MVGRDGRGAVVAVAVAVAVAAVHITASQRRGWADGAVVVLL